MLGFEPPSRENIGLAVQRLILSAMALLDSVTICVIKMVSSFKVKNNVKLQRIYFYPMDIFLIIFI